MIAQCDSSYSHRNTSICLLEDRQTGKFRYETCTKRGFASSLYRGRSEVRRGRVAATMQRRVFVRKPRRIQTILSGRNQHFLVTGCSPWLAAIPADTCGETEEEQTKQNIRGHFGRVIIHLYTVGEVTN